MMLAIDDIFNRPVSVSRHDFHFAIALASRFTDGRVHAHTTAAPAERRIMVGINVAGDQRV